MKLKSQQQLWVTPFPEMPVFDKVIQPKNVSNSWAWDIIPEYSSRLNQEALSPRLREIQAKSQEIQAQLQQLAQRQSR